MAVQGARLGEQGSRLPGLVSGLGGEGSVPRTLARPLFLPSPLSLHPAPSFHPGPHSRTFQALTSLPPPIPAWCPTLPEKGCFLNQHPLGGGGGLLQQTEESGGQWRLKSQRFSNLFRKSSGTRISLGAVSVSLTSTVSKPWTSLCLGFPHRSTTCVTTVLAWKAVGGLSTFLLGKPLNAIRVFV